MLRVTSAATGCVLVLFGCGASEPAAACSPAVLHANYIDEATRSPDGEGWCCQPGFPTCDCGYFGGFVRDRCSCGVADGTAPSPFGYCDLAPPDWILETDAHGCSRYRARLLSTACCNCFDANVVDAGGAP